MDGVLRSKARLLFMQARAVSEIEEIGIRTPEPTPVDELGSGRGRLPDRRDQRRRARPVG